MKFSRYKRINHPSSTGDRCLNLDSGTCEDRQSCMVDPVKAHPVGEGAVMFIKEVGRKAGVIRGGKPQCRGTSK